MDSVGFPEVPFVSYLIAIPDCDSVNLHITVIDSVVIEDMNIYPAPELVRIDNGDDIYMQEQFTINNGAYNSNSFFPGYTGELVEKGSVRTQNCIRIKIYPVQFNPVLKEIIAYSRVNIEMTFDNSVGPVNNDVGLFNEVCGNSMINYNSNGLSSSITSGSSRSGEWSWLTSSDLSGQYVNPVCDYLIITNQHFYTNETTRTAIENLAAKRAEYNGFDVRILKMSDIDSQIVGENNTKKMRNLIKNTYYNGHAENTYDGKIGYVLLFGDAYFEDTDVDCVPTYPYHVNETEDVHVQSGYDIYFSQLTEINGTPDVYPDVFLGRIPVDFNLQSGEGAERSMHISDRIVEYEPIQTSAPGYNEWNKRLVFSNGAFGHPNSMFNYVLPLIPENYHTTYLTDDPPYSDPNNEFDETGCTFGENYSTEPFSEKFFEGSLIFHFSGHGTSEFGTDFGWDLDDDTHIPKWTWIDADSYDNTNYISYPVIFNVSCGIGAFQIHHIPSFPEKFLTYSDSKGCIAYIGSSKTTDMFANSIFINYLYNMPFVYGCATLGDIVLFGKLKTSNDFYRSSYNLLGDPALNIMLNTDNIETADLFCNPNQIDKTNIDNQTLQITDGISNISSVDILGNILVECQLTNNFTNNIQTKEYVINNLSAMETKNATFNFDISDCMPTEFDILIKVDPNNSITERNEENNEAETKYDYYKYQENFPVVVPLSSISFHNDDLPLFFDKSIIIGGKKILPSGQILWDCNLTTEGISIPIKNNETEFDYIVREKTATNSHLYRIDGNTGNGLICYSANPSESSFDNYCVGDLNNDGTDELICQYVTTPQVQWHLAIFDLDGTVLTNFDSGQLRDIAVGDGNNDGKNELYILTFNTLTSYDYNNGTLTPIQQITTTSTFNTNFAFDDFNNDGMLDCAIFSGNTISFLRCSDFEIFDEVNLTTSFQNVALGDIDNDGITEIIILQTGNNYDEISVNLIDELENQYVHLFSVQNVESFKSNVKLYDLNSDNQLDVILQTSNNNYVNNNCIRGYSINGDLIFSIPESEAKTFSIIDDIDNDNDIEVIFGEEASDFGQYTNYKISVSDLNIPVSNHGNVYPKMNEFNNNLYSQPVIGQLAENTNYHWKGTITLYNDVILPATSTLTIQEGTVIKAKENSKLSIYGNLIANGTENNPIIFKPIIQGSSTDFWEGLDIQPGNGSIQLNHVIIQNATVNSKRDIRITNSSLISTPLLVNGQSLYLYNDNLNNSYISANLYLQHELETISVHNCQINNSPENAGIEITGYPNIDICNNTIENCNSGIKLWESGSGTNNLISNNIISNNTQYGIFVYHSSIDILDHNRISNNQEGIVITRESKVNLVGENDYPVQTINNNRQHEIRFTYDSSPNQFYYNKIYDDNHDYSYVKCIHIPTIHTSIDISNNNWGTSFNPNTDLFPLDLFNYQPIWDPGVPRDATNSTDEDMYFSAKQYENNQNYLEAEQTYKQIITSYPSSKYAKIAAKELLDLKIKSNGDFSELKQYYETEPNMQFNEEMSKISDFLINNCNIKLEEFQSAITWFEDKILNPPSEIDSVCAVVDVGYTYLLMENGNKSHYTGKIAELKPKSIKEYEKKRKQLMDILFGNSKPENENPPTLKLALYDNYPNPFNPSTTISFAIPQQSKIMITIYNLKGQKVKTITNKQFEKGKHKVIWNGKNNNDQSVASGIYFYKLSVNGKTKAVKKCLLLK